MNRNKYLPLTETTFYILTELLTPGHGYLVMQEVENLSFGRVRIAAGTMYGALENLQSQGLIAPVPGPDKRRKLYQTTPLGREVLHSEAERLRYMAAVADRLKL
ncbi:MAG TPA: PadR family transcriptional regulator [Candidatus Mediterraneibacter intestinipullorum]|nr:PadR family transcriptional regulator [Candidatus Mediterraneibacter intestinipullorum]